MHLEFGSASRLLKASSNQNACFLSYVVSQKGPRDSWGELPVLLILRSIYKTGSCVEQMNMKWNLPIQISFFFFFKSDSLI